jgi:hypothetical protein
MQGFYLMAPQMVEAGFDSLLVTAKRAGFNTVVFDVKEKKGEVYFDISNFPQLKYTFSNPILNINDTVEKLHAQGFYAVARIVVFYNVATARKHPELRPIDRTGGHWQERAEFPAWLDPSHPLVQAELLQIIDIVASSNIDEIQLDYVRFPTEGRVYDAIFYYEREDKQKAQQDSNYKKREKSDVITDFVREARRVVDRHAVKLSADVFAIVAWQRQMDIRVVGQDITSLSPYLHAIHPMVYSSHFSDDFGFSTGDFINKPYSLVKEGIERTIEGSAPICVVIPYLQAFSWRVNYNKEYIFQQLNATKDTKAKGYILWNQDGVYRQALGWVSEWNEKTRR